MLNLVNFVILMANTLREVDTYLRDGDPESCGLEPTTTFDAWSDIDMLNRCVGSFMRSTFGNFVEEGVW